MTDEVINVTGVSNTLGNGSSSSASDTYMSYRGIEDWYGDLFEFIDGVNVSDREVFTNSDYNTFTSDTFTGDYTTTGLTAPTDNGYITDVNFSEAGFVPIEASGGSSSTYVTDTVSTSSGDTVCRFSGDASKENACGGFFLVMESDSSFQSTTTGASIAY